MARKLIFLVFIFVSNHSYGSTRVLDQRITIEIKSTPIKRILVAIEETAGVVFSYNPDLVDENRIVSLTIKNQTIEYGLTLIFNKNIRFKELGNHIILLRNEDADELKSRKKIFSSILFKGTVKDSRSGQPIYNASIYEVDSRTATVTNEQGFYQFSIPNGTSIRSLYIRKKGYRESVLVLNLAGDSIISSTVFLDPLYDTIAKIAQRSVQPIYLPIEERALSGGLVSHDTYVHTENLPEINEIRMAQVSLVPSVSVGSNLSTNGLITNNFSLNILAGYSNGTAGVEVGGLLNMDKGVVSGVQVAGLVNLVGGNVKGVQVGGIANSVRGELKGVQLGGITNLNGGNFTGVQLAGIGNLAHKDFTGVQASGISSITIGKLDGLQMSGIFSAARCGFYGLQLSGISSLADSLSIGFQFSGIHNMSLGTLYGGQVAGISNFVLHGKTGLQLAGIVNVTDVNKGIQCAGILNVANKNNGLQIGLVNFSRESSGFTLGLFNYVKKGFHKTEVSVNETFPLNIIFKSGVRYLYNAYYLSVLPGPTPIYGAGFGLGSNLTLHQKWSLSMDLSAQLVFENNFESFEFSSLYKFSTTVDFSVAKWLTVFAGPSLNFNLISFSDSEGNYSSAIGQHAFFTQNLSQSSSKMWLGGNVGLRF